MFYVPSFLQGRMGGGGGVFVFLKSKVDQILEGAWACCGPARLYSTDF